MKSMGRILISGQKLAVRRSLTLCLKKSNLGADMSDTDTTKPTGKLKFVQDSNAYAAVGRAAGMLMVFPSFAHLPFGQITRILAGQVNRKHYCFSVGDNGPTGFFGWALASEEAAEHWVSQNDDSLIGDGLEGDCVVFNIWHVDGKETSRAAVLHFHEYFSDKRKYFFKRSYNDGRVRPVRLVNSRFRENSTSEIKAVRSDRVVKDRKLETVAQ